MPYKYVHFTFWSKTGEPRCLWSMSQDCTGGECKFFPHCECRQGADFDELCSASCSPEMCSRNCPQWGPWLPCNPQGFRLRSRLCPCDHLSEHYFEIADKCMEQRPCIVQPSPGAPAATSQKATVVGLSIGLSIVLLMVILLGVFGTYRWQKLRQGRNVLLDRRPYDRSSEALLSDSTEELSVNLGPSRPRTPLSVIADADVPPINM